MGRDTSEAPRVRRTQAERRSEAEQKLLRAATELIAEQGSGPTSLAQIGERAGFSRGLVNHHFGSRAALFERVVEETQRAFALSLPRVGAGTGLDELLTLVDAYLRSLAQPAPEHRALLMLWAESAGASRELQPMMQTVDRRFRGAISQLVERGIEDGSMRSDADPGAAGVAVVGQLRGISLEVLVDPTLPIDRWLEVLLDLIRTSLASA